jgi:hypothetical protein
MDPLEVTVIDRVDQGERLLASSLEAIGLEQRHRKK